MESLRSRLNFKLLLLCESLFILFSQGSGDLSSNHCLENCARNLLLLALEGLFCLYLLLLFHLVQSLLVIYLPLLLDNPIDFCLLSSLFSLVEPLNPFLSFFPIETFISLCHATPQPCLILRNRGIS